MRVIPVMDLKNGQVVHGKGGRRENYRPIRSVLVDGSDPIKTAEAFYRKLGCTELYVADLDAIERKGSNAEFLKQLAAKPELSVMVDAGAHKAEAVGQLLEWGVKKVIVGSETLEDTGDLAEITAEYSGRVVFSLDLKGNELLTSCWGLRQKGIDVIFEELVLLGVKEFILLCLSAVGTGHGMELNFLNKMTGCAGKASLLAGGGVRSKDDLLILKNLGIDGALVATALHEGWITGEDLADLRPDLHSPGGLNCGGSQALR